MSPEDARQLQTALAHQKAGRLGDAADLYRDTLRRDPNNFDCVYMLAMLCAQQGHMQTAIEMFRRATEMRPNILDVQYNLAVALGMARHYAEAARVYRKIIKAAPQHVNARNNYAASLLSAGQSTEALREYDVLVALQPDSAHAHNNRGMALQSLNRFDEALTAYDKAITLQPDFAEAHANRGNVLAAVRRGDEALVAYETAIALRPDFAEAHSNIGNIHCNRRSYETAIVAYDRALTLRNDDPDASSMRLYAKMHLCDWRELDRECAGVLASIENGVPIYPFIALAMPTPPAVQLRCAKTFASARYPAVEKAFARGRVHRHERLRVAYLSSDFRKHAVAQLMVGLLESHDRSRFEVTGLSIGPSDDSDLRRRLENSFEHFIDAATWPDDATAAQIQASEIDILVDLNGFTQGARPGIMVRRPAPIQVGYLGYSGTSGMECIDYVLADPIVIPREEFRCYTEEVVWLPDCFMAHDDKRPVAEHTPTRYELGLPDRAFVFCCFNQPYKISPDMFDLWMRLLAQVEGSVLWLKDNGTAPAENLRREAERRGIASERLVFAPQLPRDDDHLARHRQADLFLDTLPYNAHATTADALWAGLPVITCLGSTFAGRVAASLLGAVRLPELVASSPADYEALALKFARDPVALAALKQKLAANRPVASLFGTGRCARHIESAYVTMLQRARRGLKPAHFSVPALDFAGAVLVNG